jgi:hypothetical protein
MGEPATGERSRRVQMKRFGVRVIAPLGALAIVGLLLVGAGAASACVTPPGQQPTTLLTVPTLSAIAANSSYVFAQGVTNCSQIWSVNAWGTTSVYATVPVTKCSEGGLAIAPYTNCTNSNSWNYAGSTAGGGVTNWGGGGGGGSHGCHSRCHQQSFVGSALFDVISGTLYEITDGGSNVTVLATFPVPTDKGSLNMGITYDQVGGFEHQLIVTSSSDGQLWLVNETSGNVTLLVTLGTYIGGPSVAPNGFGPYAGDVLVAEKKLNSVVAVAPNGTITKVTTWKKANAVALPTSFCGQNQWQSNWGQGGGGCGGGCGWGSQSCSFGSDHDVLFVANYTSGALEAFSSKAVQNLSGQAFVAGGDNTGIASFNSTGLTTLFASQTQKISYITFITCLPQNQQGKGW